MMGGGCWGAQDGEVTLGGWYKLSGGYPWGLEGVWWAMG